MPSHHMLCLTVLCIAVCSPARAQLASTPPNAPATPEALFRSQCSLCHTLSAQEPLRQGPPLAGVVGRKPGSVPGFKYSPGFADVDFVWDAEHLNAWLTRPQVVVPGAMMIYRQPDPAIRHAIIDWLKEQH